jgi:hypothetical protein
MKDYLKYREYRKVFSDLARILDWEGYAWQKIVEAEAATKNEIGAYVL